MPDLTLEKVRYVLQVLNLNCDYITHNYPGVIERDRDPAGVFLSVRVVVVSYGPFSFSFHFPILLQLVRPLKFETVNGFHFTQMYSF